MHYFAAPQQTSTAKLTIMSLKSKKRKRRTRFNETKPDSENT